MDPTELFMYVFTVALSGDAGYRGDIVAIREARRVCRVSHWIFKNQDC